MSDSDSDLDVPDLKITQPKQAKFPENAKIVQDETETGTHIISIEVPEGYVLGPVWSQLTPAASAEMLTLVSNMASALTTFTKKAHVDEKPTKKAHIDEKPTKKIPPAKKSPAKKTSTKKPVVSQKAKNKVEELLDSATTED